jgi:hypothetical protein
MVGVLSGLASLAGCDDPNAFRIDPILAYDTVEVVAPLPGNVGLPTALDVTGDGAGGVRGGRFPELPRDAEQWDFLVRIRDGELVLIPARAAGVPLARAAVSPPILGDTFESLREVPGQGTLIMDTPVVLRVGNVHAARSRETLSFMCAGVQFAKFQPLVVDVSTGRVQLQIVTNERCGDPRLVPVD